MMENDPAFPDRRQGGLPAQEHLAAMDEREGARRSRRLALALALLCGAGILFASFSPFRRIHDPVHLARHWQQFTTPWYSSAPASLRFRLGHLIENFFFYFPLGVTVALALRRDLRGRAMAMIRPFALTLGFIMSLGVEFLQIGFENREPDLTDSAMNTLGYLTGLLLMRWMLRHQRLYPLFSWWFRVLDNQKWAVRAAALVYSTLILLAALDPLEPLMEMSHVMGRMGIPVGFLFRSSPGLLEPWTVGRWAGVALFVLLFAPLGFFVRSAFHRWSALRLCTCLLAVLGAAAMMQAGMWFDPARILGGMTGALAGIAVAGWWAGFLPGRGQAACHNGSTPSLPSSQD